MTYTGAEIELEIANIVRNTGYVVNSFTYAEIIEQYDEPLAELGLDKLDLTEIILEIEDVFSVRLEEYLNIDKDFDEITLRTLIDLTAEQLDI